MERCASNDSMSVMPEQNDGVVIQGSPSVEETYASDDERDFDDDESRDTGFEEAADDGSNAEQEIVASDSIIDLTKRWSPLSVVDKEDEDEKKAQLKSSLLALGRTESGNDYGFGMDTDDNITLGTDASSTVPTRMQMVHRTFPSPRFRGEQVTTQNAERILGYTHRHSSDGSDDDDDSRDESLKRALRFDRYAVHGGTQDNDARSTAYRLPIKGKSADHWIEIEPDEYETTPNANVENAGCFCLGYGILDYWLEAETSKRSGVKRRISQPKITMVTVEEEQAPEVREEVYDEVYNEPAAVQVIVEVPSRAADPDGSYHDPASDYGQMVHA